MHQLIHLFCLPFSGGNIYSYRELGKHLAGHITLIPLELPGHGKRFAQPLLTDIHAMTDDIFTRITPELLAPYAVYGHSLGALLGYLLAQKIRREQLPPPQHLFLSGYQAPSIPWKEFGMQTLPHDDFIRKVSEYGGMPEQVAADKSLMGLFIPMMRADFQAVAGYVYTRETPLTIPISVMIGTEENITEEEALRWQEVTTQPVTLTRFPGKHFFIFKQFPEIGRLISTILKNDRT